MRKIVGTRNPLSNIIKDTSTIMSNPLPEYVGMIVLVSLIVLLRGLLVPTIFCMVHPYITNFCAYMQPAQPYGAASCHHVLNYKDGIVFSSRPYALPCS